ncbi:hypothetical protein ACQW5G_00475 [Fructilactobacillus sp. Tb1]|uniref:hypothetical protein n=1 Tax=Fructilactobacillus sp. Tb1 TaxID=3422304 RepID=UPI003D27E8A6
MEYRDFNSVNPVNPVDLSLVDPQIRQNTNGIRHKAIGKDVRELIARSIEWNSMINSNTSSKLNSVTNLMNYMQGEFDNTLHGLTVDSEVINAREDASGKIYTTLKNRLDSEQLDHGHLGDIFGNDDFEQTLVVKGLTEHSKGLHYKTINSTQNQKIHGGIYTKDVSQISYKEVQK